MKAIILIWLLVALLFGYHVLRFGVDNITEHRQTDQEYIEQYMAEH